jgi:hypothetical protein
MDSEKYAHSCATSKTIQNASCKLMTLFVTTRLKAKPAYFMLLKQQEHRYYDIDLDSWLKRHG